VEAHAPEPGLGAPDEIASAIAEVCTDAPLPIRCRAVRDGTLLLRRDAAAIERVVVQTVLSYLDFKPQRDQAFTRVRADILGQR
jgi:hypothetical protein